MTSPQTWQLDDTSMIDSYMDSSNATTNYDTATTGRIGAGAGGTGLYRSLFKWTGLSDGTIPANATINSAIMSLWCTPSGASQDHVFTVYRLKLAWVENQVTWNIWKTGSAWNTNGADGANDRESTGIASTTILHGIGADTEKQWTLDPSAIQEIVSGAWTNNGFILRSESDSNDKFSVDLSSNATAGYRPKLVVTYALGYLQRIVVI